MTAFVVGRDALFLIGKDQAAAFAAHEHLVLGVFEVVHVHLGGIELGGLQGGFVDQVLQIGAGEARRTASQGIQIHIGIQRRTLGVDLEDTAAAAQVRRGHHHLTVETAGTQQGRVQNVGTVGGGQQDDAFVALEAVHFHQQLVQGLFAFVMATAQTGATLAAHGVDLVDEDEAGGVLLALHEQVAHTGGTHAHEHLHEVRTGDGEEGHAGLTGHGAGQQGLTGTWRAHQQHALGDAAAQTGELFGVGQEFHHFGQFVLGFIHTGHVLKGHTGRVLVEQARAGTAKAHGLAAATLHLAHEEDPDTDEQQHGEPRHQQGHVPGLFFRRLGLDFHLLVQQAGHQLIGLDGGTVRSAPDEGVALDLHRADLPAVHTADEIRVGHLLGRALRLLEHIEKHDHRKDYGSPEHQVATKLIQFGLHYRAVKRCADGAPVCAKQSRYSDRRQGVNRHRSGIRNKISLFSRLAMGSAGETGKSLFPHHTPVPAPCRRADLLSPGLCVTYMAVVWRRVVTGVAPGLQNRWQA